MWLALVTSLLFAHEPGTCPEVMALATAVQRGPLPEASRACANTADLQTPRGRALAWVAWRDLLWREGESEELRALTTSLLESTPEVERTLDAAEILSKRGSPLASEASARSRELLAQRAWSTDWELLAARWRAIGTPTSPQPRPPQLEDVRACADLGRLWLRGALGGVYATDRDCAVRLTETLSGEPRQRAAELAALLAARHGDANERRQVLSRLEVLVPDNAAVAAARARLELAGEAPGTHSR